MPSDLEIARRVEPDGVVCTFCGGENTFADDCGWWYLYPNGHEGRNGPACEACYDGEPGRKHIERYGVGER